MNITVGRIVHCVLSEEDAGAINRRRTTKASIAERITQKLWPLGAQAHIGNHVKAGETYPAIAVRIFGDSENPLASFQVFLDGNDNYWAIARFESANLPGSWHWPSQKPETQQPETSSR